MQKTEPAQSYRRAPRSCSKVADKRQHEPKTLNFMRIIAQMNRYQVI